MLLFDAINADFKSVVAHLQHASRTERSVDLYKECIAAMEMANKAGDDAAFILFAQTFGLVIDQAGYSEDSIAWLKDAQARAERMEEPDEQAHLLHLIGRAYYSRGEYQVALEYWANGMKIAKACDGYINWAWCKLGIGQICDALDATALAVQVFSELGKSLELLDGSERRLPVSQRARFLVRLRELRVINTVNLAVNELRLGLHDKALGKFESARAQARSLGLEDIAAECEVRIAEVAAEKGDTKHALELLVPAEQALEACTHPWGLATLFLLRAHCLAAASDFKAAMQSANLARVSAAKANATHISLRIEQEISDIAEKTGELPLQVQALKSAIQLKSALEQGSRNQTLRALQELAMVRNETGPN
jgi:tetratricopeptide (TPR) repeat protein